MKAGGRVETLGSNRELRTNGGNLRKMARVYIGLGANLPGPAGPPEAALAAAAERLGELGRVVSRSSLYSTAPVGLAEQPRFLNAVVALETELAPSVLLEALLEIERALGRDRSTGVANGPRTLDLDILLYGDVVLSVQGLLIPHPRLAERAFVLAPLSEIAPQMRDPRTGVTVGELFERVSGEGASKDVPNAVVHVESEHWRAGVGYPGGSGGGDVRAKSGSDSTDSDSDHN
jgi:2-amino-4-hydroxy-6-hydroxymethyldihydropteridine diphosphokinase